MEEKTSFWQLLEKYKIEIPKIQRAYAQGRLDEKTELLVEDFLNDIKDAVLKDKPLNLNFIYGKIENGTLIPIDGQQRLTTLFLLHWYFLVKEGKILLQKEKPEKHTDDTKDITYKDVLQKFTYETRLTSIDFCKGLIKNGNEFVKLFNDSASTAKISDSIKDSSWYFSSWRHDPTVVSMLNMIDKLHEKFKDVKEAVFEKLQKNNSPITFYFLPMENFKLTDELYIKMNERGKQLTDFENFKTLFSGYLEMEEKSELDNVAKLDNEWLDIFWNMEKNEAKKDGRGMLSDNVDKNYYIFFENITSLFYAENNTVEDIKNYSLFKDYATVYSKQEYVKKIIYIFNALTTYKDDENIFKKFISDKPTYWERIRFYALCLYFIWQANDTCSETHRQEVYHNWVRIAKNLINNTQIEKPEDYKDAVKAIKKLSLNIEDILTYISKYEEKLSSFSKRQTKEEKLKAQLILNDKEWQPLLETAEKHSYFDGQVGFILEYARVKDEKYSKEDFKNYSSKLMKLFSDEFQENHKYIFQRALLSKGNYLVEFGSNHSFCSFEASLRGKTDNWRKVFNDTKKTLILKALLDDIKTDNILDELKRIVKESNISGWQDIIIKNPECISYCGKRKIRFINDGKIYLISRTQMNSHHAELFSYNLFQKVFKRNKYKPFSSVRYYESTSYEQPYIVLDSFIYKKHEFYMDVQYAGSENYNLIFSYRGDRKPEAFNDISNILQKSGFKKKEKEKIHLIMSGITEAEVEKRVKEICQNLIEQLEI